MEELFNAIVPVVQILVTPIIAAVGWYVKQIAATAKKVEEKITYLVVHQELCEEERKALRKTVAETTIKTAVIEEKLQSLKPTHQ